MWPWVLLLFGAFRYCVSTVPEQADRFVSDGNEQVFSLHGDRHLLTTWDLGRQVHLLVHSHDSAVIGRCARQMLLTRIFSLL